MVTYQCYVKKTEVGTVDANGSLDARQKAKEKFGKDTEPEWNAKKGFT